MAMHYTATTTTTTTTNHNNNNTNTICLHINCRALIRRAAAGLRQGVVVVPRRVGEGNVVHLKREQALVESGRYTFE